MPSKARRAAVGLRVFLGCTVSTAGDGRRRQQPTKLQVKLQLGIMENVVKKTWVGLQWEIIGGQK